MVSSPNNPDIANLPQSVITLNGQSDYIEISNRSQINLSSTYTLEVWLKSPGAGPYFSDTKTVEDGSLIGQSLLVRSSDFKIVIGRLTARGGWYRMTSNKEQAIPQDNGWHHIAFVYCPGDKKEKIFVDGELDHEWNTDKYNLKYSGGSVRIGFGFKDPKNDPNPLYFKGQLAEVRYWNKALSQSEIQAGLHQRLQGNEPGLAGYWPLNEGSGNIARDKTSYASNGKIVGCTWDTTHTLSLPLPNNQTSVTNPGKQSPGTGLKNYGYWHRWKQSLPQQRETKPFRRGRIWS